MSDGENDFIALEDLTFDGYTTTDRAKGLDFNQCKQIMVTLGKFHAISLAFRDQEPNEFDKVINVIEVIVVLFFIQIIDNIIHTQETYYNDKFRSWYEPYQVGDIDLFPCKFSFYLK